jgi:hypothetical protein
MQDHDATVQFGLHVFGDWETVIGAARDIARETSDDGVYQEILNQKPFDEDQGDYDRYSVKSNRADDLFGLWQAFRKHRLETEVFCGIESIPTRTSLFAATGSGYGKTATPNATVRIDTETLDKSIKIKVKQALNILRECV